MSRSKIILAVLVFGIALFPAVLGQVQNHPLSQVLIDRNLNLTGVNITNASYIFFGNNSNDVNLYRDSANVLRTDDSFIVSGTWLNATGLNISGDTSVSINSPTFFVNTTNGRVGIGTTSPSTTLQVTGNTTITNNLTVDSGTLHVSGLQNRVGVGTTNPQTILHVFEDSSGASLSNADFLVVESDSTAYITILTGTTSSGGLVFGDSGDSNIGYLQYNHNGNSMAFGVNAGERMRIDSSGRLGIGTTSPTTLLTLWGGNLNASGNNVTGVNYLLFGNGTDDTNLYRSAANILRTDDDFVVGGTWLNVTRLNVSTSAAIAGLDFTGDIDLNSNDIVEGAWINGTNLNASNTLYAQRGGIGITTPLTRLHASENDINIGAVSYVLALDHLIANQTNGTDSIGTGILLRSEDSVGDIENVSQIEGVFTTATNGSEASSLLFYTRTGGNPLAERMRIDGSGRIGINTTSPSSLLNLVTHSTDTRVAANISNYGSGFGLVVEDSAADTTPFVIDSSGNVGIGTSTPLSTVDVSGNLSVSGSTNSSIDGSTFFIDATNNRAGIGTTTPISLLHVSGTGSLLNVSNSTHTFLFANQTANGVGIGTTWPQSLLHVVGTGSLLNASLPSISSHTDFIISDIGAPGNNAYMSLISDNTSGISQIQFGDTDDEGIGRIRYTHSDNVLGFFTSNLEAMRIGSNGNIGVNTTSAQALLNLVTHSTDTKTAFNVSNLGTGTSLFVGDSEGDTTPFVIDNAGRVGIGTATPVETLSVVGSANISTWLNASSLNITGTRNISMDSPTFFIDATNNRVGIGTVNPLNALNIIGALNATTNILAGSWMNATDINASNRLCVGTSCVTSLLNNMTGFGIVGYIPQWSNGTALNNSNIFQLGANVGIGTTTPSTNLDINGDVNITSATGKLGLSSSNVQSILFSGGSGIASPPKTANTANISLVLGTDPDDAFNFTTKHTGMFTSPAIRIGQQNLKILSGSGYDVFIGESGDRAGIRLGWGTNTWFTRNAAGARTARFDISVAHGISNVSFQNSFVGINTTSPQELLHISAGGNSTTLRLQDADGTCNLNPESGSLLAICSSDESLKTNVKNVSKSDVVSKILSIPLKQYDVKITGETRIGPVAQDLQLVRPEMVHEIKEPVFSKTTGEQNGTKTTLGVEEPNVWELTYLIQEQQKEISSLKAGLCKKSNTYPWC